jgi:hypothetical protein
MLRVKFSRLLHDTGILLLRLIGHRRDVRRTDLLGLLWRNRCGRGTVNSGDVDAQSREETRPCPSDEFVENARLLLRIGPRVHLADVLPPAPKLNVEGKLDPRKATASELRGQEIFSGKGRCAGCHQAPYYTDNLMHNLQAERFYTPRMVNGMMASADGPIKTFPLRGVKDSPQTAMVPPSTEIFFSFPSAKKATTFRPERRRHLVRY